MNIRMLSNQLLLEELPEQLHITQGGIELPQIAKPSVQNPYVNAKVLAVGPGRRLTSGKLIPTSIKVDDIVKVDMYGARDFTMGGKHLKITREDNVVAFIQRA
jgi:co-chaperonin GroES (HSP10)